MPSLSDVVRRLVADNHYVVSEHASERLMERGIMEWQVVVGLADAVEIRERPSATPNPVVEVVELLADGTEVKAVWALLPSRRLVKLVTVHFFD